MEYIIYFLAMLLLPLAVHLYLKATYAKYNRGSSVSGKSGGDVARAILDRHGLQSVAVEEVAGVFSDHYDPRQKTVRLSSDNFHGASLSNIAVAAHEVGHALQDAQGYFFLTIRHALVPVASLGSNLSFFLLLLGILFQSAGMLLWGIVAMAFAVVFQLVTLPVEYNASSRAQEELASLGTVTRDEEQHTRKVLHAAALTYVAGTLVAVLELVRFMWMFTGLSDD